MYKHARAFRRVSDNADAQDDEAFFQRQKDAAGGGELSLFTISRVAYVRRYRSEGINDYAALARKLNGIGLHDANDAYWTPSSLKSLVENAPLIP